MFCGRRTNEFFKRVGDIDAAQERRAQNVSDIQQTWLKEAK